VKNRSKLINPKAPVENSKASKRPVTASVPKNVKPIIKPKPKDLDSKTNTSTTVQIKKVTSEVNNG
jgi:hypothetical protein